MGRPTPSDRNKNGDKERCWGGPLGKRAGKGCRGGVSGRRTLSDRNKEGGGKLWQGKRAGVACWGGEPLRTETRRGVENCGWGDVKTGPFGHK